MVCCLLLWLSFSGPFEIALTPFDIHQETLVAVGPESLCIGTIAGNLFFFDAQGKMFTKAGGSGQGPGEFGRLASLSWSDESHCFIAFDGNQKRISCFSGQGEHVKDIRIATTGSSYVQPLFITENKRLLFTTEEATELQLVSNDEDKPLTLARLPELEKRSSTKIKTQHGPVEIFYRWDPTVLLAGNERIAAICHTGTGKVYFVQPTANPQPVQFSVSYKRKLVSDEDKKVFMEGFPKSYKSGLTTWEAPEFWPIASRLLVDDKDQVWVFGQNVDSKGYPFTCFDRLGKPAHAGQVASLPTQIGRGNLYTFQIKDDSVLVVSPVPQ